MVRPSPVHGLRIIESILNAAAKVRASKVHNPPAAIVRKLDGVRDWIPANGGGVNRGVNVLSYLFPVHWSAADDFPRIKAVLVPARLQGTTRNVPVIFGSKHNLRPYSGTMQVLAGGNWREFPVHWPIVEYVFQIPWLHGLHQKPSIELIYLASRFRSQLRIQSTVDSAYAEIIDPQVVKRGPISVWKIDMEILALIQLGIPFAEYVRIQAKGPDAQRTMEAVQRLFREYNDRKGYRGNIHV